MQYTPAATAPASLASRWLSRPPTLLAPRIFLLLPCRRALPLRGGSIFRLRNNLPIHPDKQHLHRPCRTLG